MEENNNKQLPAKQKVDDKDKSSLALPVDKKTKKISKIKKIEPKEKKQIKDSARTMLSREAINPVWLSLFEAAKLGGIDKKTIKRAIKSDLIKYKIVDNRYQVEFRSIVLFIASRKRLLNKLNEEGIGQYIEKWIE
ncbi:MAG: hypothetical protein WC415_06245 [Patescibacteria group bacterium]